MNRVRQRSSVSLWPEKYSDGERVDDRPLVGIGVLRLVDEDVVGALVELEADPFAHPVDAEQAPRPGDEVVEIGDPGGALGEAVGAGEGLAGAKARGLDRGEDRRRGAGARRLTSQCANSPTQVGVVGVDLELARGHLARLALGGDELLADAVEQRDPLERRGGEEGGQIGGDGLRRSRVPQARLASISSSIVGQVDFVVGEPRGDGVGGVGLADADRGEQRGLEPRRVAERVDHFLVRGRRW